MSKGRVPRLTLGRRMRLAREDAHIGSSEMAELLGVVRHTITGYEMDRHSPNRATLKEWARITDTPIEWLMNDQVEEISLVDNERKELVAALIEALMNPGGSQQRGGLVHPALTRAQIELMPVDDLPRELLKTG